MGDSKDSRSSVYITSSPVPVKSAIGFSDSAQIPKNAVVLSNSEVLAVQYQIIEKWKPRREMAPFTYGWGIIGGITIICGSIINSHYRRKFQLFEYRRFATFAQATIIPSITALITNKYFVTEPILLRKYSCPICIQLRASVLQTSVVLAQVPILSFLSCALVASYGFRYTLPPLKDFQAWFKTARKMTKPIYGTLLLMVCFNMAYAGGLAYKQMTTASKVHEKMLTEVK